MVFLHGVGDTSFRWIPYAEALPDPNVFAIDIMGDVGNSIPDVGFETSADLGIWLTDTIDALDRTAPHIVGMSLGGYVAVSHAVQGGRTGSLVLLDPVGILKLRLLRFIRWGGATGLAAMAPGPIRRWAGRRLRQPLLNSKGDVRAHMAGSMGHPMTLPPIDVFTDEQLASIGVPVHVSAMVERVANLIPHAQAVLLPDAGHALALTHPDRCIAELRAAISSEVAPAI